MVRLLGEARLLTLTGAGGSGKTRLAAEALGRTTGRWEVTAWIDLAQLHDPAGLANHVGAGFGLTERAGEAVLDGICRLVAGSTVLLVLDNCEHVIDAAATTTEALLSRLPGLTVLATSREALGVQGETAWLVPPLTAAEARELFLDRARAAVPSFALTRDNAATIVEICRRLDGIPLAIELAAARVKLLTVEQIESRLRDALRLLSGGSRTALPRHRTLRATIEWSHALLTDPEQRLLRRLAIFPADFDLEAAEAVTAGAGLDPAEVLDTMGGLVDKSLVLLDTTESAVRYRLLETVRQFGLEQLEAAGETAELAARHAAHYLAVAEEIAPRIIGGTTDRRWIDELRRDVTSYRAAVEWSGDDPARYEIGLRFVWALFWFWWGRGSFVEALRLRAAVEPGAPVTPLARIRGYIAFSNLGNWQGRLEEALAHGDAAVTLAAELDEPMLLGRALTQRAATLTLLGHFDRAEADTDLGLERLAHAGCEDVTPAILHHFRGIVRASRGDIDGALESHRAEESLSRDLGHLSGIVHGMTAQAALLFGLDRRDEALGLYRESFGYAVRADDGWGIAKSLEGMACCIVDRRPAEAVRALGSSDAFRERIAHPRWPDELQRFEAARQRLRQLVGGDFDGLWDAGRSLGTDEAGAILLAASGEGAVAPAASPVGETPSGATSPPGTPDLQVRALGEFRVSRRGLAIDPAAWGSARPRELLLLLLLTPGGLTKEQAGLVLWPDASPTQLRNNFHVTLHRLRRILGEPEWIVLNAERYRFAEGLEVDVDAIRFERAVRANLGRRDPGAVAALAEALSWYRAPFLDGESVGDWALDHRDRLARCFAQAAIDVARARLAEQDAETAIGLARQVVSSDPVNEPAWQLLITGLARAGRRAEALKACRQCRAVLAADLEVDPDPETVSLHDRIQAGEVV